MSLRFSDTDVVNILQNICPAHVPDIVIFIDAITIVFEEAPKDSPIYVPVSCIEAGNEYSLPSISLRFISFSSLFGTKLSVLAPVISGVLQMHL